MIEPYDHKYRLAALESAVAVHTADEFHGDLDSTVLDTARSFLMWLRNPMPATSMTLYVGPAIPE